MENLERRFFCREQRETVKEGSGNGASLFMGVLRAEPGRPECYVMKDSGNGRLSP